MWPVTCTHHTPISHTAACTAAAITTPSNPTNPTAFFPIFLRGILVYLTTNNSKALSLKLYLYTVHLLMACKHYGLCYCNYCNERVTLEVRKRSKLNFLLTSASARSHAPFPFSCIWEKNVRRPLSKPSPSCPPFTLCC